MEQIKKITATMKFCFVALVALTLASCNTHETELNLADREKDSLVQVLVERDNTVTSFLESYNEIQLSLDSVAKHGESLTHFLSTDVEMRKSIKTNIKDDIATINKLMKNNREKIAALTSKVKGLNNKNEQLVKLIETLNDQLVSKDCELELLNQRLAQMNENVTLLQTDMKNLQAQNSKQVAELYNDLHTVYYVVGKSKDLIRMKVIDKNGGLLGMGKTSKLTSNFDSNSFIKGDFTEIGSIAVNSKTAKLISTHPRNSYLMDKDATGNLTLRITDVTKFWSASKFLVIVNG